MRGFVLFRPTLCAVRVYLFTKVSSINRNIMADVAEVVEEVPVVEKEKKEVEKEKKVVEVEVDEKSNDAAPEEHKENGKSKHHENGDAKAETNGVTEDTSVATKRKSGAGDAPEAVDGTPEKKAKVVTEENEESNSTNGSSEVAVA